MMTQQDEQRRRGRPSKGPRKAKPFRAPEDLAAEFEELCEALGLGENDELVAALRARVAVLRRRLER